MQQAVIAAVLAGRDVLARAETGSGKTAAFGLPLLQRLDEHTRARSERGNPVSMLVVAPTRELVLQTADVLSGFARPLRRRIKLVAAHGGGSVNPQMMALRGGADIVVATPGRLLDLHRRGAIEFATLQTLVLDEGDRLLGPEFMDELVQVVSRLPARRQNLLFSATFSPQVRDLARVLLRDPLEIGVADEPVAEPGARSAPAPFEPNIEQHVYEVAAVRKTALLIHLLRQRELGRVLVFVSARKTGDKLVVRLNQAEIQAAVFHADKSQHERTRRLEAFRAGNLRVLIATDLAARGIDVEELSAVINFELPRSPNDYIHRIGRTGRAGRTGLAISLICAEQEERHFRVIEKRIRRRLPRESVAGFEPR
ncbi:MAG TPA: DEAD/DEAH box helicase [Polyangiales bacterium]|nr:DEAD/DEAH box helicase [Polyangiales bacterium]